MAAILVKRNCYGSSKIGFIVIEKISCYFITYMALDKNKKVQPKLPIVYGRMGGGLQMESDR